MQKGANAYRSIGEAARLVGVAPHVLRYWESQFPQLKPVRRPDGRRYYRPDDIRLAAGLVEALREDGLTTRGAAKLIARDDGADLRARGAARLPEIFALPAAAPPQPSRNPAATTAKGESPMPPAPRPDRNRGTRGAKLPLFPDLAQDATAAAADTVESLHLAKPATRSLPDASTPSLNRLSDLSRWLRDEGQNLSSTQLKNALETLRHHLSQRS